MLSQKSQYLFYCHPGEKPEAHYTGYLALDIGFYRCDEFCKGITVKKY